MGALHGLPVVVTNLIWCVATAVLGQLTSDVAVANIFLPITFGCAQAMKVSPIVTMLPVALSCSLPYVLIVSTPPNAIGFSTGFITQVDLLKHGTLLVASGVF